MKVEISKDLIHQCKKNNRTAQKELYLKIYNPMLSVSKRYYTNENDALTAFHNAYLKILDNLKKYSYEKSFINWCKTILVNMIIDDIRKNKKRVLAEINLDKIEFEYISKASVSNLVHQQIDSNYFNKLIEVLPPATRTVFNLFVFEDFSHKDISKKLNISEGTSKWHVSSAKKQLEVELDQYRKTRSVIL